MGSAFYVWMGPWLIEFMLLFHAYDERAHGTNAKHLGPIRIRQHVAPMHTRHEGPRRYDDASNKGRQKGIGTVCSIRLVPCHNAERKEDGLMLTPEDIHEDNYINVVSRLMLDQFKACAAELESNCEYWSADFISDDGTDYTCTALNASEALMYLRYEGSIGDLKDWLFTSRVEFERLLDNDEVVPKGRFHFGPPLCVIDSAGGLSEELSELSNAIIESTEE